jgi:multiple sugar transport system substrate-binding protein
MQALVPVLVAAVLAMAPLGAKAADLVVWWDEGYYPEEHEAVREIIAAFEQESGKQVELVFHPEGEHPEAIVAALGTDEPPDFAFGFRVGNYITEWASDDRLADLSDAVGHFSDLFDPDALAWFVLANERTGQKALYALPVGRSSYHIHVWKSLLERAGFTLADIPKDWDPFWAFWCDEVQPGVRKALGRDDVWGAGLPMSADAEDTRQHFVQFMVAYEANWVTPDGRLVIDDPVVQQKLVKTLDSYTAIYRKGCTPPDSVTWANSDNNKQFHAQAVVMTINQTLSIPNALKHERPEDYYENTATVEWPLSPDGKAFPIGGGFFGAVVFKDGGHVATAKEFVRFLLSKGWLMHYLDFSAERLLPAMPKLLDAPFWLDPSDPHRMAAVMQIASRPMHYDYAMVSGNWRYDQIVQEHVWAKAVHRVAADGISPEQAVDEAIARIKEILSE